MSRGMVLAFAVWWDVGGFMDWLDGTASGAGPCNSTEGNPEFIKTIQQDEVDFIQELFGQFKKQTVHKLDVNTVGLPHELLRSLIKCHMRESN